MVSVPGEVDLKVSVLVTPDHGVESGQILQFLFTESTTEKQTPAVLLDSRHDNVPVPESILFASKGDYDRLESFLAHNSSGINAADDCGKTPLWWAVWNNQRALYKLLLKLGKLLNICQIGK